MRGGQDEGAGAGVIRNGGRNTAVDRKMGSDRSRDEMPRSELGVWVAVVSAARWALTGLHEDAFHGLPQAVLAGSRHGVHLHLTVDGTPVLLPRH